MRLIISRMVYNFNLWLNKSSNDCAEKSKLYMLWDKDPLNVYLPLRQR